MQLVYRQATNSEYKKQLIFSEIAFVMAKTELKELSNNNSNTK